MKLHGNARTCPHSRLLMVRRVELEGWTLAQAAEAAGVSVRTVSKWLRCYRYEGSRPGELLHVDVKKLGRIRGAGHRVSGSRASQRKTTINGRRTGATGWEFVHICVDDATRLAYIEVLDDEKATTAAGFLTRAVAHFRAYGIRVEQVMTDNGSCYRAVIHALACKALRIKHPRT